jgi:thiol-disulfide isomerase/thioredoxin
MTDLGDLTVQQWLNAPEGFDLSALAGQVVLVECFQMLCPGCVSHGLPIAKKVHRLFRQDKVTVLGLHTVFEHHQAQSPISLAAFLHEYAIPFPVGVDRPGDNGPLPQSMARFQLQGTPSLLIFDQSGHLRQKLFGQVDEMALGALVAQMIPPATVTAPVASDETAGCDREGCPAPEG